MSFASAGFSQVDNENRIIVNSLEDPISLHGVDNYLLAKERNVLVYGVNYTFEGITPENVTQTFIDLIDPYAYMTQRKMKSFVSIPIPSENVVLIFHPIVGGNQGNVNTEAQ